MTELACPVRCTQQHSCQSEPIVSLLVIPQISRGMLLIIMESESAAGGNVECIPLRIHDITDGTLLKVCSP